MTVNIQREHVYGQTFVLIIDLFITRNKANFEIMFELQQTYKKVIYFDFLSTVLNAGLNFSSITGVGKEKTI